MRRVPASSSKGPAVPKTIHQPAPTPRRGMDYTPQRGGPSEVGYGIAQRIKAGRRQTVHEIVDRRLSNFEGDGLPPLQGQPTVSKHDVLLPSHAPDHCSTVQGLCDHYEHLALPQQIDLVAVLTLKFDDHELRHRCWEQSRAFIAAKIAAERELPAIVVFHRPSIAARALQAHVHALVFLRRLPGSDFGAFCKPLIEPAARAVLAAEWTLWRHGGQA